MRTLAIALTLALLAAWPADAQARGGTYRGPGGAVPPMLREPSDPTPPPPPPPRGFPIVAPPGTNVPTTPPPPTPPGAPTRPRQPAGLPHSTAMSFADWRFWYHHNQELFETRGSAGLTLARGGALTATRILPALLKCLDADRPAARTARAAAYIALGKIADTPELVARMRSAAASESDVFVREAAILALGLLRRTEPKRQFTPELLDAVRAELLGLVGSTKLPARSRAFAASALGLLGDQPTRSAIGARALNVKLFRLLDEKHNHPDLPLSLLLAVSLQPRASITDAQREAVRAMARTGEIAGRKRFIGRAHAALALGRLGGPDDVAVLLDLLQDVRDRSHNAGRSAAIAVGRLGRRLPAEARSALLKQMIKLMEPEPAEPKPGEPQPVPILDPTQRGLMLIALAHIAAADLMEVEGLTGRIGSVEAFARLRLTTAHPIERTYAGLALGLLGRGMRPASNVERRTYRQRTTALLRKLLADTKALAPRHRGAFAIALGLMGPGDAQAQLLALLNDRKQDPDLRGACARGLALMGAEGEDVRAGLVQTLTNRRSEALGIDCAAALGQLGQPAAGPALRAHLERMRSEQTKGTAAAALGGIGASAEVPALIADLGDAKQSRLNRAMAAAALGRIGDPEAIPSLARITGHMNWRASTDFLNEIFSLL